MLSAATHATRHSDCHVKGWAEGATRTESRRPGTSPHGFHSQIPDVTRVVSEIIWYCQRTMYTHWKNSICKCQSKCPCMVWSLHNYITKSLLLFTMHRKADERKTKLFHRCKLGRGHGFILPLLPGTWPGRRKQANKTLWAVNEDVSPSVLMKGGPSKSTKPGRVTCL